MPFPLSQILTTGLDALKVESRNRVATQTLQNNASSNGNGTEFDVTGYGVAVLQVTGTFSATINFEGSVDGTNYVLIPALNRNTSLYATSTTTTGIYEINCKGFNKIRAGISSYSSGNVTVFGRALTISSEHNSNTVLTGSSIQDSQAIPMTQAQRDVAARAYENIIDTIGMDNIVLFLPMWEASGTEFKDIIHPDVTFVAEGPTLAQQGVLHPVARFDGVNDYARQKPMTEWTAGSATYALNSENKKVAQRFPTYGVVQGKVKFVTFKLQRVGSPAGTLQIRIVEDSSGNPTGTNVQTSVSLDVTTITSTGAMTIGLPFSSMGNIIGSANKRYWVVLEYATVTTVDESNYINVYYDSSSSYGEPMATYNGSSWTVQSGQSLVFAVYNNALDLTGGNFSIIAACIPQSLNSFNTLALLPGGYASSDSGSLAAMYLSLSPYSNYAGDFVFGHYGDGIGVAESYAQQMAQRPEILVGTFSKEKSTGKVALYRNGRLLGTASGTAGQGVCEPYRPMFIGASLSTNRISLGGFFNGMIGPVILTKTELTQSQVSSVTNQLYALQLRGGA